MTAQAWSGRRSDYGAWTVRCNSKADRRAWLAARRDGWGASDVGKVCRLTPYGNSDEVRTKAILVKAFPELDTFRGNANTWAGNTLATPVAECWHDRTKHYARVEEWEDMLVVDGVPHLYVTPDWRGYVAGDNQPYPIEVKCVDPKVHAEHWAKGGKPPKHVTAQAMFQAWAVGASAATVVQWHWGAYPKDYTVEVNEAAIAWALGELAKAWLEVTQLRHDLALAHDRLLAAGFAPKAVRAVLDRPVGAPEPGPLHAVDPEPEGD